MQGNGKAVLLYNARYVRIQDNTVIRCTDTSSAAIRIRGNVNHAVIRHNLIVANHGAAMRIDPAFTGPSSDIRVNYNDFSGNTGGAVIVDKGGYTGTLDL